MGSCSARILVPMARKPVPASDSVPPEAGDLLPVALARTGQIACRGPRPPAPNSDSDTHADRHGFRLPHWSRHSERHPTSGAPSAHHNAETPTRHPRPLPRVRFSGPLHDFQRLLGGRQAQHIQPYPSKEGLRTCRGSRCQTSGFELIQNEGIDRPSHPRRIDHRWNGRPLGWLPCPMSLIGECPGHPHKTPKHGEEMVATFHG